MNQKVAEQLFNAEYRLNSFKVTRDVPIDVRFVISSINELDVELPKIVRYHGLMFFCLNENEIYYFKSNIETPIKLSTEVIKSIKFSVENYQQLEANKNDIADGQITFVRNLNANFQKVGDKFVYHSGDIIVDSIASFNSLPSDIKPEGINVSIKNSQERYFIKPDKTLELQNKVYETDPENPISGRIYNVNGNYKIAVGGNLISIGKNEFRTVTNITEGFNSITHNLNTDKVSVHIIKKGNQIYFSYQTSPDSISFNSLFDFEECTVVISPM